VDEDDQRTRFAVVDEVREQDQSNGHDVVQKHLQEVVASLGKQVEEKGVAMIGKADQVVLSQPWFLLSEGVSSEASLDRSVLSSEESWRHPIFASKQEVSGVSKEDEEVEFEEDGGPTRHSFGSFLSLVLGIHQRFSESREDRPGEEDAKTTQDENARKRDPEIRESRIVVVGSRTLSFHHDVVGLLQERRRKSHCEDGPHEVDLLLETHPEQDRKARIRISRSHATSSIAVAVIGSLFVVVDIVVVAPFTLHSFDRFVF